MAKALDLESASRRLGLYRTVAATAKELFRMLPALGSDGRALAREGETAFRELARRYEALGKPSLANDDATTQYVTDLYAFGHSFVRRILNAYPDAAEAIAARTVGPTTGWPPLQGNERTTLGWPELKEAWAEYRAANRREASR